MLFGTFPGITVADSGCSASQKCEKNSCKEQELLQEQSEIKILSGFCWEKGKVGSGQAPNSSQKQERKTPGQELERESPLCTQI